MEANRFELFLIALAAAAAPLLAEIPSRLRMPVVVVELGFPRWFGGDAG